MAGNDDHKFDRELWPSARTSTRLGLGEVDVIAPGVLHLRFAGKIRLEHAQVILDAGNDAIARGYRPIIAVDASDVHAYETEVRKVVQVWIKANRGQIDGFWVLFRSPLVKMGITLVNKFIGGMIRPFTDPEEFDHALQQARAQALSGRTHARH